MTSTNSPQEPEPVISGPALKFFAFAVLILIGIGIYTIPRMPSSSPWTSSLEKVDIQIGPGKPIPQFQWSQENKSFKTDDLKGKWRLLSFWAYYCPPCQQELPELNELEASWNGPDFDIITINLDDPQSENLEFAKKFIAENQINLPVFYDVNGELKKIFVITDLPRHLLINPAGEVVWDARGAFTWTSAATRETLLKALEPSQAQDAEGSEESTPPD